MVLLPIFVSKRSYLLNGRSMKSLNQLRGPDGKEDDILSMMHSLERKMEE